MSSPVIKERTPLLPERRNVPDFFICDLADAAPKGDMASMEHPVFSLSTKPDHRVRKYVNGDKFIEIKPSSDGLATVHDRDILIYCISQLVAALNAGKEVSSLVRFRAHDLLKATNRMTNGQGYEALKSAMERLSGTRISTNIVTGIKEEFKTFGLIEHATIVRETRDGRMQEVEVKISDWVFSSIRHQQVLTLHPNYFRLRKPLERRMYEIARKHCGKKEEWKISLGVLQKKCGSASTEKEFKRLVGSIVEEDERHSHMPDYSVRLESDDMIVFRGRGSVPRHVTLEDMKSVYTHQLNPETYNEARKVAPSWDVYFLEREWRNWITEAPRDPDAAFIGFCRIWSERRATP